MAWVVVCMVKVGWLLRRWLFNVCVWDGRLCVVYVIVCGGAGYVTWCLLRVWSVANVYDGAGYASGVAGWVYLVWMGVG